MKYLFSHFISKGTNKSYCNKKGFTLIEFLIYSVIVAFMTGTLILAGVNIMQGRAKVEVMEEVNHNGRMIMNTITYHVRHAEEINFPSPGITGDYLSLEMPNAEESPIRFYVEDSVLLFERGSAEASPLISERVRVSDIQFTNTSYPDSAKTVRIEATLEYNNLSGKSEYDLARNFHVTENIKELAGIEEETSSATYVLTLDESPSAGGTAIDNTNSSPYEAGQIIDINASETEDYTFSHWSDSAGGTFGNASTADTNYIMPAEDTTVTANFNEEETYSLTISSTTGGSSTDETGSSPYAAGATVNISASADSGYDFVNWSAPAGSFDNANSVTTTFTMPAQDVTVTANFEGTYVLTISSTTGGSATDETGSSPYTAGATVNISASADSGYDFVNWSAPAGSFDNANSATTTFTMPEQDVTVTANFWDGYLYKAGDEYENITGGWVTHTVDGSPAYTRGDSYLRIVADAYGTEIGSFVTNVPIDLTGYNKIYIDWYNNGTTLAGNSSYFNLPTTKTAGPYTAQAIVHSGTPFSRRTESADISDKNGEYYVKFLARDGYPYGSRISRLYVYNIWLTK